MAEDADRGAGSLIRCPTPPVCISTPRLLLRDLAPADLSALMAYQTDPRYRRLYDLPEGDDQHAHDLFGRFLSWQEEVPRRNLQLGIFEHASGRLCGCAGLRMAGAPEGAAVMGIELTPDDWGRYRLAIDVTTALIEYAFRTLGLDRVIGDTASGNTRVARLARWFGAEIIAERPGPAWMATRGWVEVDWSLSREAWAKASHTRGVRWQDRRSRRERTPKRCRRRSALRGCGLRPSAEAPSPQSAA